MAMLVRWGPWRMAGELERDVDRLLGRGLGPWTGVPWQWIMPLSKEHRWVPACDVFARADDLVVQMELPGIDPEKDVQVSVQDGVLCISGERGHDAATEQAGYWRRESSYGAFERGIPLPEGAKAEDITASYDNGVLEIVIPKAAQLPQPTRIAVRASNGKKAVAAGGAKS
ncbi:MAG TPA: Hsp20/alpha crystallin family protein [Actinomycetes bacterium]|nr:Hsp20/alpha crystallin family protein [Actinomycetes bacterium]